MAPVSSPTSHGPNAPGSPLEELLATLTPAEFLARHWLLLPHAEASGCARWRHLADEKVLAALVATAGEDVYRARCGHDANSDGGVVASECMTIVKHSERRNADLAALAQGLEQTFGCAVDIHYLHTPALVQGYVWHCDVEEVFMLHLAGVKSYQLRKNTVHPWPVKETIDRIPFEREGSTLRLECRLEAGDWLYIPSGWWHVARAETACVSLSVGLTPPTGLTLIDDVRRDLAGSPLWRRRIGSDPRLCEAAVQELRDDLADRLKRALARPPKGAESRPEVGREEGRPR